MHPKGMQVMAFLLFLFVWIIPSGTYAQGWTAAHATFYGGPSGSGTDGGACGYGNLLVQGYGSYTAALSRALFSGGSTCGACYQLMCHNEPQWCLPGSITVTATNYCPSNASKADGPGWCNPPLLHFDLSQPAFLKIAQYRAGIVPVLFRRVACVKRGGIRFTITGNPNFYLVLVTNVGGAGDVRAMQVKGSSTGWLPMRRNWGQNWECRVHLLGQSLSFIVATSDGRSLTLNNVVPPNWAFKQTFQANQNF